ncbi:hypothetical protein ADUPG1_003005, partial [Aduncisulcus paluster]
MRRSGTGTISAMIGSKDTPRLTRYGKYYFKVFKDAFVAYRALGGEAHMFALVDPDIRQLYEDIHDVELLNPTELDLEEIKSNEKEFIDGIDKSFPKA